MGKELSLARNEEERQSVLLASTGIGESSTEPSNGDQRQAQLSSPNRGQGGKAKDIKTKSKGSRKVKGVDARHPRPERRGRDNQDRESDRGDEGEDEYTGRSAQKLGIAHPGSYCDESEAVPHYWTEKEMISSGSLFQCRFCYKYLWLPLHEHDAVRLGNLMSKYGTNEGYCRFLNRHRAAKIMLAKLQHLSILEMEMTDKRKFAKIADRILRDKDYDRKEPA